MTEQLARISARRPLWVIGFWALLVVLALGINARFLDSATTTELRLGGGVDSQRAAELLETRLRGGPQPTTEIIVVQSEDLTVDDDRFRSMVESVSSRVAAVGPETILGVQHYYQTGDESLVSQNRQTTIMPVVMAGTLEEATANVEQLLHVVREANRAEGYRVLMSGAASIAHESDELATRDLEKGERIGVPIALIILVALFGAVVASLLPLGLGVVSIIIALDIAALIGQAFELVFFVTLMITMIGLAVGIDYSLFIVSRFREELERGSSKIEAVERA